MLQGKSEPFYGHMRFDFLLSNYGEAFLLEVKSCTLVKEGIAMFPNAKTERGARHVMELLKAKKEVIELVCSSLFNE
ncbi:MAG: DNA/RNA nuclease SfsA [Candidatus Bathyarchaeia archaeon]